MSKPFVIRALHNDGSLASQDVNTAEVLTFLAHVGRMIESGGYPLRRLTVETDAGATEITADGVFSMLTE